MRRTLLFCGFTLLAVLALCVSRTDAKPETVQQIVPGVWFREGDIKDLGHCNNIVIEMRDYLIVVDANFPSGARAVLADAKRLSSKPVKYVFDTHHHGDHAYGNPIWTQAGATTLAYKGVAEEMRRYEPARFQQSVKERADVRGLNRDAPEPPQKTFAEDLFVLDDGARRVEFRFLGWAHTRGDGFVYLPKEQVLCTGDAIVNGPYNYVADGNLANWPGVVRRAQKLKVKYVLPGHGTPGGPDVMEGQARYMIALRQAVQNAVKQGRKLEGLAESIQWPEEVKNWVGDFTPGQVKDAYQQITRGNQ